MRTVVYCLILAACGGAGGDNLGANGSDDGDGGGSDAGGDCPEEWEAGAGYAVDPATCLAWSDRLTDEMDWYTAASPTDASLGGCGSDCAVEGVGVCVALDGAADRQGWRLPSAAELQALAISAPPLDPLDGKLWSRDTDDNMDGLAKTVELSQAGSQLSLGKTSDAYVRCVAD